jgi:hypothetical protein
LYNIAKGDLGCNEFHTARTLYEKLPFDMRGCYNDEYYDYVRLGCDAVWFDKRHTNVTEKSLLPPSSEWIKECILKMKAAVFSEQLEPIQ